MSVVHAPVMCCDVDHKLCGLLDEDSSSGKILGTQMSNNASSTTPVRTRIFCCFAMNEKHEGQGASCPHGKVSVHSLLTEDTLGSG